VSEAVAKHGAKLLHGNDRRGALFPPTVVDHVDPACELVREETFGPAIPIIRVKDIAHTIKVSNGTAYGLSSGVCTDRLDYITRFVDELQSALSISGGAGLSHRDVALRRHQGFGLGLQGRRP